MRWSQHAITNLHPQVWCSSPPCFESRARAYILRSSKSPMRDYQAHRCGRGPPLTPRDSWSARMCGGLCWGNGGKHERRRIGEYPRFHLHVCHLSLPSRPITCARDSLSFSAMATRKLSCLLRFRRTGHTYRWPVGGVGATPSVWTPPPRALRTHSQTQLRLLRQPTLSIPVLKSFARHR